MELIHGHPVAGLQNECLLREADLLRCLWQSLNRRCAQLNRGASRAPAKKEGDKDTTKRVVMESGIGARSSFSVCLPQQRPPQQQTNSARTRSSRTSPPLTTAGHPSPGSGTLCQSTEPNIPSPNNGRVSVRCFGWTILVHDGATAEKPRATRRRSKNMVAAAA